MKKRSQSHIFRRSIADTIQYRFRNALRKDDLEARGNLSPVSQKEILLVSVVRNEYPEIIPFLDHYRSIGVSRFAIVDDRSEDGTREFLLSQPDVDVFISRKTYGEAGRGTFWRQDIIRRYGFNRWYVIVDADEYLVYDGMDRHDLHDLAGWIQKRGMKHLLAPMIDMYPAGDLRDFPFDPKRAPWEIADHFDASGYDYTTSPQNIKIRGGPRSRAFGTHTLTKYPFVYGDRLTILNSIHAPLPYWRNHVESYGALLHFKFFSNFTTKAQVAVDEGQYWNGASKYKEYLSATIGKPDFNVMSEISQRYSGIQDIIGAGLTQAISWND
ncbi:MAG: glycosyltransferase family 2 protein [Mesorhizobium sp.]|uniref:glycosyltransferase family 2 protein n=1 Tax=Mesorhizobium sp. TaxID=1871066 RepID=UPI000FE90F33|nr:glycosyltransferase family 2 protein [Mesorhizobium sp.]RWB07677.1 MAG: glycosyltransferase family 2 protein [Mesorhizobium sp.]RWO13683.1 MAG: glycosyltransferase family 2 protein [Mesorhizobium sp.]RWP05352.1 MAG: glycosyltransferase family 2 protein [Mesorhizobium sp.]RWQ06692.1 MAG: glycosyltransferase family 2 protein [Mesorhizobium sp.]RWQ55333.1 MAG: glycosyltransferase family 2 protein [Mesorhizobium sp.]